jgi:hypothetical protein
MATMKPKLWRTEAGAIAGLAIGLLVWWSSYDPGAGLLQNPQLVIVPAALGILVVILRNRRKKVGPDDPETRYRNEGGRV